MSTGWGTGGTRHRTGAVPPAIQRRMYGGSVTMYIASLRWNRTLQPNSTLPKLPTRTE